MDKLVVYTGLFTDDPNTLYGDIIDYKHEKDGVDYVAFTNSDHLKSVKELPKRSNKLFREMMSKREEFKQAWNTILRH